MSDILIFNTENQAFGAQQQAFKCSGYGLGALIKDLDHPKAIEIGCDIGDTANFLLDSNPTLNLTSVDPYMEYQDWNGTVHTEKFTGITARIFLHELDHMTGMVE